MSRLFSALISLLFVAAACSDDDAVPTTVPLSAPVTGAIVTTTTTVTATSVVSSTIPPPTTTTTTTTTTPPTTTTVLPSIDDLDLALQEVASGFDQPVFLTTPATDPRIFVVDQPGVVWVIDDGEPFVFLDISDDVSFGGERGLLGLAFHPDYASNGLFYVNFTGAGGVTRIVEFSVSADANSADRQTARTVLEIDQPAGNHNGGMIAFGPDGNLWIGMGDGGGADDQFGQSQRPDTLLGAMLRIAVGPGAEEPYGIPPGNLEDAAPEVWAIGLRNPWRFTLDGNDLYIADVGQGRVEEIDLVGVDETKRNFGWPLWEGDDCFKASPCDSNDLIIPIFVYSHAEGCSITGGFVYRGEAIPELTGHYFYGDFCAGWIRSVLAGPGRDAVIEEREWFRESTVEGLTSFGVDSSGELYVLSTSGTVSRIVRA